MGPTSPNDAETGVSDTDSFIDEVTEEVRRDRLFLTLRKYGWIGALLVAVVVGGTAWNEWQKARHAAASEAFGDALLVALANNDAATRIQALAAVPAPVEGQAALLAFLNAEEALAAGDTAGARTALKALADDPAAPDLYRQLAQLKWVILMGPDLPPADRDLLLATLATPGAPFRPLAVEQQALELVAAGKTDEAVALLSQLVQEDGVTQALRQRATQMIEALGGAAKTE